MIDIGIASYENPHHLRSTIEHIITNTNSDWRLLVVDNNSQDPEVHKILEHFADDSRIAVDFRSDNIGYVGAVNEILKWADNHYVVYCDNDCQIMTPGWDQMMVDKFETHHEIGMLFPGNYIAYPIERSDYTEILWGVGCFWMLNTARIDDVGYFDTTLGHQEEVDYQMRMRLAGWKIGAMRSVNANHAGSASANPEASERINNGIINWVNKWNKYFVGPSINYFSSNVTRFEDWPINAIYLEEWYKSKPQFLNLNSHIEQVTVDGRNYDLIKVPRHPYLYRDRII